MIAPGGPGTAQGWALTPDLLLAGHGLLRSLTGPSIRVGALPTNRKALAMAEALIATDLHLALDVLSYLATQVTFDFDVLLDICPDSVDFFVSQVPNPRIGIDVGVLAHLLCDRRADAVDICEGDLYPLLPRDIDSSYARHLYLPSALPLLVARVLTDDPNHTVAANHLAFVTHRFDAWTNFHLRLSTSRRDGQAGATCSGT